MNRRLAAWVLAAVTALGTAGCRPADAPPSTALSLRQEEAVRAVWVNFYEMGDLCQAPTGDGFRAAVNDLIDRAQAVGLNALIVHVRSHADAFYPSALFPWSDRIRGVQGAGPDYDPLALLTEAAHARGMAVHAWINPYRVKGGGSPGGELAADNPARVWMESDDPADRARVAAWDGGLYLDPADGQVQRLILDGVREIVENYPVDGVHFDDYFYPTADAAFDWARYAAYREQAGDGALTLGDWRRAQVSTLMAAVCRAVHRLRPEAVFGISPMASLQADRDGCFADVERWGREPGFVDYLCPQLYFGFDYPKPAFRFNTLLNDWLNAVTCPDVALWVGLGAYKLGQTDAGSDEWIGTTDLLARQTAALERTGRCAGVAFYNAAALLADTPQAAAERQAICKWNEEDP